MMKRHNHFAVLGLLLVWSAVAQGAFKFIGWADNRPYDAGNRARFQWVLQEINRMAGSEPLFHVVPGDFDFTAQTNEDIANISSVKTWHVHGGLLVCLTRPCGYRCHRKSRVHHGAIIPEEALVWVYGHRRHAS